MRFFHNSAVLPILLVGILMAGAGAALVRRVWPGHAGFQRTGSLIQLDRNGDLQRAFDQARPGDTIVLQAGAVYKGPFTLPAKSGTDYITIQTSRVSELPEGVRVSPAQADLFAKLQSAQKAEPVVKTAPGAHHYKFIGVEISTTDADLKIYDLVRLGDWQNQTELGGVPHHFVIDRSYIHGFETQEVQRGVALNVADGTVENSYIAEIHGKGYDTQAICGWNGPGPFKIINNYLEGSGENVMFGGADPKIPNLVPAGIEVRNNYVRKPLSWHEGDPSYRGHHWTVKNLFELKNARNVVIDGNIFENNWVDAQSGAGILFTVRNEQGTAPWSIVENVQFTNNIVKNSPSAVNLLGSDNLKPSQRSNHLTIANNLFIDIKGAFLTMSGFYNVTIEHNTHFQSGNIMTIYGQQSMQFVYRNNITVRAPNGYGVKGDATGEGTIALNTFTPEYVFEKNVIAGARSSDYPPRNAYPGSVSDIGFVSFEQGDYRLQKNSRFRATATDGTDPGCNPDKLPKLNLDKR